jgi:hypothetical protein
LEEGWHKKLVVDLRRRTRCSGFLGFAHLALMILL